MAGYSPRLAALAHLRKPDLLARYLLLVATDRRSYDRKAIATAANSRNLSRDQLIARILEAR